MKLHECTSCKKRKNLKYDDAKVCSCCGSSMVWDYRTEHAFVRSAHTCHELAEEYDAKTTLATPSQAEIFKARASAARECMNLIRLLDK